MYLNKLYIFALIVLFPILSFAMRESPVTVENMVFCTAIKDRNPIGTDIGFLNSVGKIYCFTKLSSALDTTSISHIWYWNNTHIATVDLKVNGKSWRTWSSKTVIEEWTGIWRVDVVSPVGGIIHSQEFLVRPSSE
jgi:hypothetical protein